MFKEIMDYLIPIAIVAILGIASKILIPAIRVLIHTKTEEFAAMAKSAKLREIIWRIGELIDDCVVATNQNYVDKLKGTDAWTPEAQAQALRTTTSAVMRLITTESLELLQEAFTDAQGWIIEKIDSSVNANKAKVK